MTFNILWPLVEMKKFPAASTANPLVAFRFAAVAAVSYILEDDRYNLVDPATILMIPREATLSISNTFLYVDAVALVDAVILVEEKITYGKLHNRKAVQRNILTLRSCECGLS